jgi:hypothetical protein
MLPEVLIVANVKNSPWDITFFSFLSTATLVTDIANARSLGWLVFCLLRGRILCCKQVNALRYFRLPPWCSTGLCSCGMLHSIRMLVIHSHFVVSNSCASFHFHPPTLPPPPPAHPPTVLLATSHSSKPDWFLYSLRTNHNPHSFLYNISTSSTCWLVFFLDYLTLEDATNRLSQNVSK